MTVTIRPEDEQLIVRAIQTGAYKNPDDVIGRALQVLRSEEEWLSENQMAVSDKIERAFAQFERGEFLTPEQSKADMEQRKLQWMRDRQV